MPTRRALLAASIATGFLPRSRPFTRQQEATGWQFPIGWPDAAPLAGFVIRHGFQTENTWYNPGWWHTGEDYYAANDEETGGAAVYAVAAGEVVYAAFDYPGRVVIVQHADSLYSMYGHLDPDLAVDVESAVDVGDRLGTVLAQVGGRAPSHLHFEIRQFITTTEVNGSAPRYGVNCGVDCPPGPGYWPIDAPELPVAMGWRNPTHVIGARLTVPFTAVATRDAELGLHDTPDGEPVDSLTLAVGETIEVSEVETGPVDTNETGAAATRLWFGTAGGWLRAFVPDDGDTGSDGRPSSLVPLLVPSAS